MCLFHTRTRVFLGLGRSLSLAPAEAKTGRTGLFAFWTAAGGNCDPISVRVIITNLAAEEGDRMKIMERKYVCRNGVVERTRYAVGNNAVPRGKRKKGNTSIRKQEANNNSAIRRAARILNCNYSHENGLLLTLDYSDAALDRLIGTMHGEQQALLRTLRLPIGEIGTWSRAEQRETLGHPEQADAALDALKDAAEREFSKWLRRIRRKVDAEIRFLSVTSDLDGTTGEIVRVHHHVVLAVDGGESAQSISWDLLRSQWHNGGVDIQRLRRQRDYTPVASYLLRQVRHKEDAKKYRVSKGMMMPEISEREILGNVAIKAPAGAIVVEQSAFNVENVTQYIRYIPKKAAYGDVAAQEGCVSKRIRHQEEKGGGKHGV